MLRRHLLVWLCLSSLTAYLWPWVGDPFVMGQPSLPWVIVVTMFSLGCLLPVDELQQVARNWPLVVGGTAVQYVSMPCLAWVIATLFALPAEMKLGVIMVGCVPGAMASNVLTLLAGGNVSYSLMLTTMATCLSPLAVPIAMKLTMNQQLDQPLLFLVWRLCWMVLIPVVAGHLVSWRGGFKQRFRPWGENIAALAILWIIAVVVGLNRQRLSTCPSSVLWAVALLNLGGYGCGMLGARLLRVDRAMRRALVLEIGMQNAGLGTTLAALLFAERPSVMIPTAIYTFGCMLTGSVLARYWSGRMPKANGGACDATSKTLPRAYES